ncbi:uncharacterized protein LOC110978203 isoform X2 [Acanthaster planci]|uniref:Uncharacterized protein LOC110978203 isoform X2 n=1 Tax=Acanthaster planci TaxID=133434 RepID=A0A8B7Y807_ACAPL|nr:uncharacterized protein LOC110978203 isoform X2 [Acanthaster planci]
MKRLEKFQLELVIFLAIYIGTSHAENLGGCYFGAVYESDYYQNNQIFTPWYDGCTICQCLNGDIECYNTCDKPLAAREWIVPSITAAVALLISLVVSLCVCCCVKSNGRNRPAYYGPGPAQRPGNYATCRPRSEETAPLTNYQVA